MLLVDLALIDYGESLNIQSQIIERKIRRGGPDVLLLLEHPPTITLGKSGTDSDVLVEQHGPQQCRPAIYRVDRGGKATYHGPGQLVGYPIVALKPLKLRVREYVHKLEETLLMALAHFGVTGFQQKGKVGIWVGPEEKIASIGVKITRWVTSHGFSLNVDLSMDPAKLIVTCGMPDARMVSLNQYLPTPADIVTVKGVVAGSFGEVFGVRLKPGSLDDALGL